MLITHDPQRLPELEGAEIVSHDGQHIRLNLDNINFRSHSTEPGSTMLLGALQPELHIPGVSLNANHLDALMESSNRKLLRPEWRRKINGEPPCYFFWGTVYRNERGLLFVRYLTPYNGSSWHVGRQYLNDYWYPNCLCAEVKQ